MTPPHSSRWSGLKDYMSHPRDIHHSAIPPSVGPGISPVDEGHSLGRSTIHSLSKWAGQNLKMRRSTIEVSTVDEVHLFPGWATKQPRCDGAGAFNLAFHISGFARSRRTPEFLTRSQRAFLRVARSFVSIPKDQPPLLHTSSSSDLREIEAQLHLPPRPDEITDDYDDKSFEGHFRNSADQSQEMDDVHLTPHLHKDIGIPADIARLHENLESRLKLFWASSLSSRRIHLSVFLDSPDPTTDRHSLDVKPLLTTELLTGSDGYFSDTFTLDWTEVWAHAFGTSSLAQHQLLVRAQVVNTESNPGLHETPINIIHIPICHSTLRVISDIDDTVRVSRVLDGARAAFNQVFVKDLKDSIISEMGAWYDTMWKHGVRFHYVSSSPFELLPVINEFMGISKLPLGSVRLRSYTGRSLLNGLLSAPADRKRANVIEVLNHFPDSKFLLVGDTGEQDLELYSELAIDRPQQIVGVFIRNVSATGLENPTGPKAYHEGPAHMPMNPRSNTAPLLSSNSTVVSSPLLPKRALSDVDILPAHLNPIQILEPTRTGQLIPASFSSEPSIDPTLLSRVSEDSSKSLTSSSSSSVSSSSSSSSSRSTRRQRSVTEGERKRLELQNRVNKARLTIPSHIILRVFENPCECVEAEHIIHQLMP